MRDVATRICREYLSGAWKTISSEEIQVKRIRWGNSCDAILWRILICFRFQRWSIKLFVLCKLADGEKRIAGGEWVEENTQGKLSQCFGADALLGAAADLRSNSRRACVGDDVDGVGCVYAAERTAIRPQTSRNLPRWSHRTVHSREYPSHWRCCSHTQTLLICRRGPWRQPSWQTIKFLWKSPRKWAKFTA